MSNVKQTSEAQAGRRLKINTGPISPEIAIAEQDEVCTADADAAANIVTQSEQQLNPIASFTSVCEKRAELWVCGDLTWQDAVGGAQYHAHANGVGASLGQNEVQKIMAKIFGYTCIASSGSK